MKKLLSVLMGCAMTVGVMAVPARRDGLVRTQSDGTQITVYQHGDELYHYLTNEAGEWLEQDAKGDYQVVTPKSEEEIAVRRAQSRYAEQAVRRAQKAAKAGPVLSPKGAIILVSFNDVEFSTSKEYMTEWAMGENFTKNGATGSINRYFKDVSWGQYNLQLDVFGPVTLSRKASYYGQNKSNGDDLHADDMIVEACQLAAQTEGADFSQYDYDGDGKVDWVVVIYAGKGEADGGAAYTVWPHQYDLSYTGKQFQLQGKTIDHYCCLNEIDGQTNASAGIGTFCHEFSHIMGLPDIYSTDASSTHKTLGQWDLMDYGPYNNDGNTPPAYSAYERWFMGWFTPTLLKDTATYVLPDLSESKAAGYINSIGKEISDVTSPNPSIFYMLENRQNYNWDAYLPGEGLIITKISYNTYDWKQNTVNYSATKMGIDLVEADGKTPTYDRANPGNGYFGKAKDAYPAGSEEFTAVNKYQVTNIALENEQISLDLNGGGEKETLATAFVIPALEGKQKIIIDGQLYILYKGTMYNVQGMRVN